MKGPNSDKLAQATDGRGIDERLGALTGEAAQQRVERIDRPNPVTRPPGERATAEAPDYYGLPVLKEPTWIWTIPAYFFVGGAAGAASALGAAATLAGGPNLRRLDRRCQLLGTLGDAMSAGLLVYDLGRPERFLNMLRVFRPTSPMSVGAWVLSASGACNATALLLGRAPGPLGRVGRAASVAGLPLGVGLAGYTGVLLANTAVPVWQAGRRALPPLFMASGMTAAASLLELLENTPAERRTLRLFGTAGKVGELLAGAALEREVGRQERVAAPLRGGATGGLWQAAKAMTAASLALSLLSGRSRRAARAASLLGLGGSLALRFAVFYAGKRSARDPQATFQGQRAGLGAAEVGPAALEPAALTDGGAPAGALRRSVKLPILA